MRGRAKNEDIVKQVPSWSKLDWNILHSLCTGLRDTEPRRPTANNEEGEDEEAFQQFTAGHTKFAKSRVNI